MNNNQWIGVGVCALGILIALLGVAAGPAFFGVGVVVVCVGLLWFAVGRMQGEPKDRR